MIPTWLPSSPMRRTSGTRMRSLTRVVSRSGGRRSNFFGTGTRWCGGASSGQMRAVSGCVVVNAVQYSPTSSAPGDLVGQPRGEAGDGLGAGVARPVAADRDLPRLGLPVAHDEDVGDLAQLGVADLAAHGLRAGVDLGPQAGVPQRGRHLLGVGDVAVGDGQ